MAGLVGEFGVDEGFDGEADEVVDAGDVVFGSGAVSASSIAMIGG